jgi:thiamine biosynthesis protein ThiS
MKEKIDIEVRLFAYLRELFPSENRGVKKLEIPANFTIDNLLDEVGVKEKEIMIVMVNGLRKQNHNEKLKDGDRIGIFPPVGGG